MTPLLLALLLLHGLASGALVARLALRDRRLEQRRVRRARALAHRTAHSEGAWRGLLDDLGQLLEQPGPLEVLQETVDRATAPLRERAAAELATAVARATPQSPRRSTRRLLGTLALAHRLQEPDHALDVALCLGHPAPAVRALALFRLAQEPPTAPELAVVLVEESKGEAEQPPNLLGVWCLRRLLEQQPRLAVPLATDHDPGVRRLAMLALADQPSREPARDVNPLTLRSLVSERLADPSPEVRGAACRAAHHLPDEEGLESLERALDDPAPEIRRDSLESLVRDAVQGIPRLVARLPALDPESRTLAFEILARNSPQDTRRLWADPPTEADALSSFLTAIGALGGPMDIPPTIRKLANSHRAVRSAAAQALLAIGLRGPQPGALTSTAPQLLGFWHREDDEGVLILLAELLALADGPMAEKAVLTRMGAVGPAARELLLRTLARIETSIREATLHDPSEGPQKTLPTTSIEGTRNVG